MEKSGKMGGENKLGQRQLNYHDEKLIFQKNWHFFSKT